MAHTAGQVNTLAEQIGVDQVGEDEFVSAKLLGRMGNSSKYCKAS